MEEKGGGTTKLKNGQRNHRMLNRAHAQQKAHGKVGVASLARVGGAMDNLKLFNFKK